MGESYEGELAFGSAEGEVKRLLGETAGRALLLSDGRSAAFAAGARSPRAIGAVFDGDCLPLFLMPDGVSRVLAAGGPDTLLAARYFAEVRGIPCTLFPTDGSLDGVFPAAGEVLLGGDAVRVPLGRASVFCDLSLIGLAGAYARLLLSSLADFEARALTAFGRPAAAGEVRLPSPGDGEGIVRENARRRRSEACGVWRGEGSVLKDLSADGLPEWSAYCKLSALYAAFFEKGRPRRYFTPDYGARAKRAGVARAAIPTAEEYARAALTLERMRAGFAAEALSLVRQRENLRGEIAKLYGKEPPGAGDLAPLARLPECAPWGLSAIIRDFGLMEWDDDEGKAAQ